MSRGNRPWEGEWLVAVDDEGRVLLPHLNPHQPIPTHYRVTVGGYNRQNGEMVLVPMKVATADDLRPQPVEVSDEEPIAHHRLYTDEEREALRYTCPYCNAAPKQGCFARPSGRPLTDYPENTTMVHSKRLGIVLDTRRTTT